MNSPKPLIQALQPPNSVEAEQYLIGALIIEPGAFHDVCDIINDADFYRDDHRRIYRHIRLLTEACKGVDVVTIFESISSSNEVDQTGGLAYLAELANNVPSAAIVKHHAAIIRKYSLLRALIVIGETLAGECYKCRNPADIAAEAEKQLAVATDETAEEPAALHDVMADVLRYVDSRSSTSGLRSGFEVLDRMTGGFEPGQLIILAARPSVGKTLMACNIVDNVVRSGRSVLFSTLEMTREEIGMRILSSRSRVSVHAMRAGTNSAEDWQRMSDAVPETQNQRLWIDDRPAITVNYLRAKARRMQRQYSLDLLVVDYIGLMKGTGDNRTQELGSISRGLKALAKELRIPIIALAQLNRGVEGRSDKRPLLSDLRDSGEIEADADIVLMLHREELYNASLEWANLAELMVRKQRNGPIGEVDLWFDGRMMQFSQHTRGNMRMKTNKRGFGDD